MKPDTGVERSLLIHHEGMRHAPENELGVVFLFSKLARRLGFVEVDRIQPQFPDCWAYRNVGGRLRRVWIEFEFKSHSFKTHVKLKQLDRVKPLKGYVVCWDHDWPDCEKHAEVIPLRQELDCGRQVWIQNTRPKYHEALDHAPARHTKGWHWTVAQSARPGDLVLMYRAGTATEARKYKVDENLLQSIANIFVVRTPPVPHKTHGWVADVSRITGLDAPLRYEQMKADRVLGKAPFVRTQMFGQHNASAYWYRIYDLIRKQNPNVRQVLSVYSPEKL